MDGREGVTKAQELKPHVLLMDITMPTVNGIEATREILRTVPEIRVVMLSQHDAPQLVEESLRAGAAGYVVKSSVSRDLMAILKKLEQDRAKPLTKAASRGQAPNGRASV